MLSIRDLERTRLAWLGPLFLAKQFGVIAEYVRRDDLMLALAQWLTDHTCGSVQVGDQHYSSWVDALCPTDMTAVDVVRRCQSDRDFSVRMVQVALSWQEWVGSESFDQEDSWSGWALRNPGPEALLSGPEFTDDLVQQYISFGSRLGPAAGLCPQWTWLSEEIHQRM